MMAGDGEGMIDAANAGLLDGAGVVRYSASYPEPAELRNALAPDTTLVVTDENRDRARIWGSVLDNLGYTEQAGEKPLVDDPNDARLPLFPGEPADAETTTQQRGVRTIQASIYGNTITYTPEDRAARALDGDVTTAWRAAAFGKAVGQYLRLQLATPVTTDHLNLVQPVNGGRNRWITAVDLIFDGHTTQRVALDASSRSPAGQTIAFPMRRFSTLEIRIAGTSDHRHRLFGGADSVGFAEIRLRDRHADHDVRVDEVIQMPQDLLRAVGTASASHPLVILMQRDALRPVPPRTDPELDLARTFTLPSARTFALTGGASVNPGASDSVIDGVLDVGGVRASASESLPGCLQCRAASAADGDATTAWNTPFVGTTNQWVQLDAPKPVTVDRMRLQVVADGRHSLPTAIELQVDGAVRERRLPPSLNRAPENATVAVSLHFPPMRGRSVRVTITAVKPQLATRESTGDTVRRRSGSPSSAFRACVGLPGDRAVGVPRGPAHDRRAAVPGAHHGSARTPPTSALSVAVRRARPAAADDRPRRGDHVGAHQRRARTGWQIDRLALSSAAAPRSRCDDGRVTGLGQTSRPRRHRGARRCDAHAGARDRRRPSVLAGAG
jgi:hypothetical protein